MLKKEKVLVPFLKVGHERLMRLVPVKMFPPVKIFLTLRFPSPNSAYSETSVQTAYCHCAYVYVCVEVQVFCI